MVEASGVQPGATASRWLGQLAHDEGMLVLVTSQSDAVALEHAGSRGGLLTWALVRDGLEQGPAAPGQFRSLTLREWLEYGEERFPELLVAMVRGEVTHRSRAVDMHSVQLRQRLAKVARSPRLFAPTGAGRLVLHTH